jgi:hypothetical protein
MASPELKRNTQPKESDVLEEFSGHSVCLTARLFSKCVRVKSAVIEAM